MWHMFGLSGVQGIVFLLSSIYPIYMDPLIRVRPDFGVHVKGVQERLVNVVEERQLLAEV